MVASPLAMRRELLLAPTFDVAKTIAPLLMVASPLAMRRELLLAPTFDVAKTIAP